MRIVILFLIFFTSSSAFASDYSEGIRMYNMRAKDAINTTAKSIYIDSAMACFKSSLEDSAKKESAAIYLLKCYYYKGAFTKLDKSHQKETYKTGRDFGAKMIKQYPKNGNMLFWYMTNYGKWGEAYGVMAAAREGLADKLKVLAEKLIVICPSCERGGSYKMLGALHYEVPYIPFFLTWPDNEEAIKNLKKSLEYNPVDVASLYYLALVYEDENMDEKAIAIVKKMSLVMKPRPEELIEDRYYINEAKKLYEKWNK